MLWFPKHIAGQHNRVCPARLVSLLVALTISFAVAGCSNTTGEEVATRGNATIAALRFTNTDGSRFYMRDQQGRTVVLVFWATWCSACKRELVRLEELATAFSTDDLLVAAVCTDPENTSKAQAIAKTLIRGYPVLNDAHAAMANKLNVTALPTTIVIGPDGSLQMRQIGFDETIFHRLRSVVERTLAETS